MNFLEILMLAVGLAMDATAVCLGVGATEHTAAHRSKFRLAFHFGLFQALMPIIGWFAGTTVTRYISAVDHWIAFGLLAFVGGRMIRAGLNTEAESYVIDPSRGRTLVMLSVATSIDALAVGLSLAMLKVTVWYPALIIGVVTAGLSLLGLLLGRRLGDKFGKRMETLGGAILILIGLRIVVEHLLG